MPIKEDEAAIVREITTSALMLRECNEGEEFILITQILGDEPAEFFELACVGVKEDADDWMKEVAKMAGQLRHVRYGFDVTKDRKGGSIITCPKCLPRNGEPDIVIHCEGVESDEVEAICRRLHHGAAITDVAEFKRMKAHGREVSKFEPEFAVGDIPGFNLQCR